MPDIDRSFVSTLNDHVLLHTDPSNTAMSLSVSRTDVGTSPLARVSMFGAGKNNLQGTIVLETMNSGTANGPLEERMRVHTNGNIGIGTMSPEKSLHVQGGYSAPLINDGNDRPGIAITGDYPELDLFSGKNNLNHGPTIRLGAYNDDSKTSFKHWVIGTAGRNAAFLDIGYSDGNNPNPHAGIRAYNGRTVLTLLKNGNVGIGVVDPQAPLHVKGNGGILNLEGTDHAYIQWYPDGFSQGRKALIGFGGAADNNLTIANEISGAHIVLKPSNGNVYAVGSLFAGEFRQESDARYKDDIENFSDALDKVSRLRGVSFKWRDRPSKPDKGKQFGLIAQEVKEVLPEAVCQDELGFFSIAYNSITSVLIEAIKEQQAQVSALAETIKEQQVHINKVEETLSELQGLVRDLMKPTRT